MLIKCKFHFDFLLYFVWGSELSLVFLSVKAQEMEPYMLGASTGEMRYQSVLIFCLMKFF